MTASSSPPQDRPPQGSTGLAIIAESAPMLAVMKTATRVADGNIAVLIQGEPGTGKELLARFLHERSRRRGGPFVAVNCAAIPEHLLESELFGHERGAFTGAAERGSGRFELAHGGTLFLDEVGNMPLQLQAKVLRALEEREGERVSGGTPVPIDVRLIAATSRNLDDELAAGCFSEDLYYRLAAVVLTLPPLHERGDDIRLLAEYCIVKAARAHRRPVYAISQETLTLLRAYSWPGNVRQLCDVIERAVLGADGPVLLPGHLPVEIRFPATPSFARAALREPDLGTGRAGQTLLPLAELERRHIQRALLMTGGHLAHAAESLGIHRNTLRRKLQEYGIEARGHAGAQAGDGHTQPASDELQPDAGQGREGLHQRLAQA